MEPENVSRKRLKNFFEQHAIIAPIVLTERKQSVLVHINPLTLTAELYYKPNLSYDNSNSSSLQLL